MDIHGHPGKSCISIYFSSKNITLILYKRKGRFLGMLYLEKIPYLKVYKQKITMPIDTKRSSLYSMIFLNSPDVDSSILTIKHQMIDSMNYLMTH